MGYSCTAQASNREQEWGEVCFAQTGTTNNYQTKTGRYFFVVGDEQRDGAITGSTWKVDKEGYAKPSGSFRIEADGTVSRWPTGLKKLIMKGNNND